MAKAKSRREVLDAEAGRLLRRLKGKTRFEQEDLLRAALRLLKKSDAPPLPYKGWDHERLNAAYIEMVRRVQSEESHNG